MTILSRQCFLDADKVSWNLNATQICWTKLNPLYHRRTSPADFLQPCRATKDIPRHAAWTNSSLNTQLSVKSQKELAQKLVASALWSCSSKDTGVNLKCMYINNARNLITFSQMLKIKTIIPFMSKKKHLPTPTVKFSKTNNDVSHLVITIQVLHKDLEAYWHHVAWDQVFQC